MGSGSVKDPGPPNEAESGREIHLKLTSGFTPIFAYTHTHTTSHTTRTQCMQTHTIHTYYIHATYTSHSRETYSTDILHLTHTHYAHTIHWHTQHRLCHITSPGPLIWSCQVTDSCVSAPALKLERLLAFTAARPQTFIPLDLGEGPLDADSCS